MKRQLQTTRRAAQQGLTIVETLVAMTISAMLLAATAVAMDASFYAYAAAAESASTQASSRLMMQRTLALIRSSTFHDAYDPNNVNATLGEPAADPVKAVGIQMLTNEEKLLKIWWQVNASYGDAFRGDVYYQLENNTPQIVLPRVEAQADANNAPYIFSLGSRSSPDGLLLLRATIDLTIHHDNEALGLEANQSSGQPVRMVGSTIPRKNVD